MTTITLSNSERDLLRDSIELRLIHIQRLLASFHRDNDEASKKMIPIYYDEYNGLILLKSRLTDEA